MDEEKVAIAWVYWRSAASMSVLIGAEELLAVLNTPPGDRPLLLVRALSLGWISGLIAILWVQRKRPTLSTTRMAFALAPLPLFPALWALMGERAMHGLPFEPFIRQELLCVLYALATPPSAVISLVVIGAFTTDALVLRAWSHHHLLPIAQPWQPWSILLFGAVSALLAIYRARAQRTEVGLFVLAERAAATERLARAYIAVRDLMNTPLQTLKVSTSLLCAQCPEAQQFTGRMRQAVEQLHRLNHLLDDDSSAIGAHPPSGSFDPVSVLQALHPEKRS